MATEWTEAPTAVIDLAEKLIDRYHQHLKGARIALIMRSEAPTTNGRMIYGKARKVSAEQQVHIPYDFIIWLAQDKWRAFLTQFQKEALLDHGLSHCQWDGFTASIKGHDVEEFNHIIERYGYWWPGSDSFEAVVQQALPMQREQKGGVGTLEFNGAIRDAVTTLHDMGAEFITGDSDTAEE